MIYQADRLVHAYRENSVLDLSGLAVPEGSRFLIDGPNGSGKSTLVEILAGLMTPTMGTPTFMGEKMEVPLPASLRAQIGYMAQQPFPLPGTVLANVMLAMERRLDKAERKKRALGWLDRLGILPIANRTAGRLSVGQFRRVALARVLAREVPIWIFDEPFAFADEAFRQRLEQLLEEHHRKGGTTILTSPGGSEKSVRWATHTLRLNVPNAQAAPPNSGGVLRMVK